MAIYFDITENNTYDTDFIIDVADETESECHEINIEEPYYHDDIYLYQGAWYHRNFPVIWAMTHETDTGPSQCSNCADFGCVNHVFIGYCANCAIYEYGGERGRGFIDNGVEIDEFEAESAFDTYLSGIDINKIQPIYKHVDLSYSDSDVDAYSDIVDIESFEYDDIEYENNISFECAESVLI
jgi:hypothetical protein